MRPTSEDGEDHHVIKEEARLAMPPVTTTITSVELLITRLSKRS